LGDQFQEEFSQGEYPQGNSVRGSIPRWKDTFSIDDKGGEIYQMQSTEKENRGMVPGGAMVTGGE
jgi:hypothetical protein